METEQRLQVSVAMCTYNGARFIEEQLWSIFRQTLLPKEIVVSDDNSSDQTLLLIEKTFTEASNSIRGVSEIELKIIQNTSSLGVTKNFEQAISSCTHELIALCDQDDVWVPFRLERMVSLFDEKQDLLLLHHDSLLVDENKSSLGITMFENLKVSKKTKDYVHKGQALDVLLKRNIVTGATTVFHQSLFEIAKPFPENWLHDEWLGIVGSSIGNIDLVEEPMILYRQHANNQVGAKKLGLRHVIGRMIHPRTERNKNLLNRSETLYQKIALLGVREKLNLFHEKLEHEKTRSSYSPSRWFRLKPVFIEVLSGRYSRYGLGLQDVLRDLVQSPK